MQEDARIMEENKKQLRGKLPMMMVNKYWKLKYKINLMKKERQEARVKYYHLGKDLVQYISLPPRHRYVDPHWLP